MNKKSFIKQLDQAVKNLDYRILPQPPKGATRVYYKFVDSFILTLGIELSNFYLERFTGSFYLSKTFTWSYAPPNLFPQIAYQRIGCFLTEDERKYLLDPEFSKNGVIDAWWKGFSPESLSRFLEAIKISEKRFIEQDNIFSGIKKSELINKILDLVQLFRKEHNNQSSNSEIKFEINYIIEWTRKVVSSNEVYKIWNNKFGVPFLADEIWRQYTLVKMSTP